jgi:hypothetical protein
VFYLEIFLPLTVCFIILSLIWISSRYNTFGNKTRNLLLYGTFVHIPLIFLVIFFGVLSGNNRDEVVLWILLLFVVLGVMLCSGCCMLCIYARTPTAGTPVMVRNNVHQPAAMSQLSQEMHQCQEGVRCPEWCRQGESVATPQVLVAVPIQSDSEQMISAKHLYKALADALRDENATAREIARLERFNITEQTLPSVSDARLSWFLAEIESAERRKVVRGVLQLWRVPTVTITV